MVTTIAVAIAICVAAPTLAAYPGYFGYNYNSVPYPYQQQLGPHYPPPFTVPASTTPFIYPQHAPPLFTPPLPQPLPVQQPTQIYSPPDVFRGFAYETAYNDGGVSQVIFVRGPDAKALLEQSIRSFTFSSLPVLPLPATKFSIVQQNHTTKPGNETKEPEPTTTTSTTPDADTKADGPGSTAAPLILPVPHSTVTPFIGSHAPGAFFYSVQVRPPEIDNSLTPSLPYFARSFFNPPTDFFRRISIPHLFSAPEVAKLENSEASSNSSDDASLKSDFSPNSEGDASTSSNDISSPSPPVTSYHHQNDDTTTPSTDTQAATDSPTNNGSDVSEESTDSNGESNASNTESSVSSESSSSDTSSDGNRSDFDITGETSNSADESTTTSNIKSDSSSSSSDAEDAQEGTGSSTGNESSSTDEPSNSDNDSTEVPTTVAAE